MRLLHPDCALLITKEYAYATIAMAEILVTAGLDSRVMDPDLNAAVLENWARATARVAAARQPS